MVGGDNKSIEAYDLVPQGSVNCLANSPFQINMQFVINDDFEGELPETQIIRRLLILKIKNSSVYFYYPIEAVVFESSYSGSIHYS
jgi:hypothetical protein